jgi:hypothetical protein
MTAMSPDDKFPRDGMLDETYAMIVTVEGVRAI